MAKAKKARAGAKAKVKAKASPTATAKAARARRLSQKAGARKTTLARRAARELQLTFMIGDYEIVRALRDGTVKARGIELAAIKSPGSGAIHDRVAHGRGADINEYNGGHYVVQKAHGRADITAIPVFLHRRFRHGFIYINTGKGIARPADLAGKRVACRTIGAAANYWMRAYLEEHGAPHRSITWVIEQLDEASSKAPKDLRIEVVPKGKTVAQMVLAGEVDAIIQPNVSEAHDKGDPRIARLWPNYKAVETDYYRRTGFFPIMHVVGIRRELAERHPWLPSAVFKAFEAAKEAGLKKLSDTSATKVTLPFVEEALKSARTLMGEDYWSYGVEQNRRVLDYFLGQHHAQGLSSRRVAVDELFHPATTETFKL